MSLRQGLRLAAVSLAIATAASLNASAADPGVVATAPTGAGAPPVSAIPSANDAAGAQIASWIASDGGPSQPDSDRLAPRTIHGEVSAGVGTNGYRNVSGVADIPVGRNSDVIVVVSSNSGEVRGGRYGYRYGGDALGLGFYGNGVPDLAPSCGRQPWSQTPIQAYGAPGPMNCSGLASP